MSDEPRKRNRARRKTEPVYALGYRRELRQHATAAEQLLWAVIRGRRVEGVKFRRQESIGRYIVDFVSLERNLVIELDGDYHDYVVEADLQRQQELESLGYRVLRFWNEDVLKDVDAVVRAIKKALE